MIETLLQEIRACTACADSLPLGPRPVVAASRNSRIVIVGQAPGLAVHQSGVPWDDKSGDNLREWLDVDKDTFYDPDCFGIVPMGFCYPGRGKSGDLPPHPECAPLWHARLWAEMKQVELTLLVGQYAQKQYLGDRAKKTLTETVKSFREYLPEFFVLPHPSPRNNIWQAKNAWFKEETLPALQERIAAIFID